MKPALSFIGAGKVGQTLARLWHAAGYDIVSVYSRTAAPAQELADATGASAVQSALDAAADGDVVFLTVPDDAIAEVAEGVAPVEWQGRAAVHTSGAASLDKLAPLHEAGAMVGSLHPAFPFADVEKSIRNLPGAAFATEASHSQLQALLTQLVAAIQGVEIRIPAGGKATYHAALVIASNYTVTLYAIAERLLATLGADESASAQALSAIISATVNNLVQVGTPWALTGPLTRADVGTIQAHLEALDDDDIRAAYVQLARLTLPMLRERGVPLAEIERILQENL